MSDSTISKLPRLVVCAAMLMRDGEVITGVRHFSPEMRKTLQRIYGDTYHLHVEKQGFVDQRGTFMTREEAMAVATDAWQIRRRCGGDDERLYSENLY